MLVALYVVQNEDAAVAGRKFADGILQGDPVNDGHTVLVFRPLHDLDGGLALRGRVFRRLLRLRKCINTWLTVIRCSQVVKAESPRKLPILLKSWMKVSCVR